MTILSWMAYAALCAAAFALIGIHAERVAAERRRAQRGIWAVVVGLSVLLPVALAARATLRAHAPAATPSMTSADAPAVAASSTADMIALTSWGALSLVLGAVLAGSYWRTTFLLRSYPRAIVAGEPAVVSENFGPALVGVIRPRIVLPAWTLHLDRSEQLLVVTHEAEHRSAHDPALLVAGACAVVLMPWNAALWFQLMRLRTAIELDCDARVVHLHRHDPIVYGSLLVSVRELAVASRRPMLALLRTESALSRRVEALALPRRVRARSWLPAVGLASLLIAAVGFVPAPSMRTLVDELAPRGFTLAFAATDTATPRDTARFASTQGRYTFSATYVPSDGSAGIVRTNRGAQLRQRRVAPSATSATSAASLPPIRVMESRDGALTAPTAAPLPEPSRPATPTIRAVPNGGGARGGRGGFISASPRPDGSRLNVIRAIGAPKPDSIPR